MVCGPQGSSREEEDRAFAPSSTAAKAKRKPRSWLDRARTRLTLLVGSRRAAELAADADHEPSDDVLDEVLRDDVARMDRVS